MEFLILFIVLALVVGVTKLMVWIVKAGVFVLVLPLKILIGLFAFGLTLFILAGVALPILGLVIIPVVPLILIILGIVWLLK